MSMVNDQGKAWVFSAESGNPVVCSFQAVAEFWQYRTLFLLMVKNRITDRYHGSVLGVLWTLLNPLLTMLGLVVVFPLIAKFSMPNYTVYLLSGIVCWTFISNSLVTGGDCYLASRGIVKNIYLPRILLPCVFVSAELVGLILAVIAVVVLCLLFGLKINLDFPILLLAVLFVYFFCVGMAMIMSVLMTNFRDVQNIIGVVMQTLFYVSAIIYPVDILPPSLRGLMDFNVFHHFVYLFQAAIYGVDSAGVPMALAKAAISSLGVLVIGFLVNARYARNLVFRL